MSLKKQRQEKRELDTWIRNNLLDIYKKLYPNEHRNLMRLVEQISSTLQRRRDRSYTSDRVLLNSEWALLLMRGLRVAPMPLPADRCMWGWSVIRRCEKYRRECEMYIEQGQCLSEEGKQFFAKMAKLKEEKEGEDEKVAHRLRREEIERREIAAQKKYCNMCRGPCVNLKDVIV